MTTETAPTSLDPYGQLLRMLLPRAHNIAIYDRTGLLLWAAEACESEALHQLAQDRLRAMREMPMPELSDLNGETICTFPVAEDAQLLGLVAIVCEMHTDRLLESLTSLMRPALAVLSRELHNQYNIEDMRRDLQSRDNDLALLLEEAGSAQEANADDFNRLLKACVAQLGCKLAALLVPGRNVAAYAVPAGQDRHIGSSLLSRTHRHLIALAQVQRRTIRLNHPIKTGPLANLGHKVLACPIFSSDQRVVGVIALFRSDTAGDYATREIHLAELLARRIAQMLMNSFDAASGLLTRVALDQRVRKCLSRDKTAGRASVHLVIYVDIDRIHVVNEICGMHIGDEVIARVGAVIREVVSPKVAAAKISGDRFALFVEDSDVGAATLLAESLRKSIAAIMPSAGTRAQQISASFGIAALEPRDGTLSHGLASAEAACKAAKDRGRNRVEVFAEADHSIIRRVEDVILMGTIREALDSNRFFIEAQPIVSLQPGAARRAKFELLLRMQDDKGNRIPPDKFFVAAERYQLVAEIDRWVVRHVFKALASVAEPLVAAGATFAINISGQSLGDEAFLEFLTERLTRYKLPASLVSFELTETAAVSNIVRAEAMMRKLRALGHEIALDDFGKGLSSLSYLQSLPVSSVKIDGSLIRHVTTSETSQAMIRALVELTRAMRLKTTAECIESEHIRRAVAELGVDEAQGFEIGHPVAFESVIKALITQSASAVRAQPAATMPNNIISIAV